ncbi:MAG: undecaprenyl-diphosphate phosphatase [Candidatus Omnitrophota bacterium]
MLRYIILGISQGITEFLPVSSSGHLVIMQHILGITYNQLALSVVLHLGTAFALAVFFFRDLLGLAKNFKLLRLLFIVTIITAIIGLLGKDFFEALFSSVKLVALALIVTGIILILTKKFIFGQRKKITFKDALVLGFTQSIAIIPGISRSGITISTLLFRGIDRENSFRFSFLAAMPVIFGAAILEAKNIDFAMRMESGNLLAGFVASFLAGIISLKFLKMVLKQARLHYLGYYCIIIAIITLIFI